MTMSDEMDRAREAAFVVLVETGAIPSASSVAAEPFQEALSAFLAELSKTHVVVPREELVEELGRALASAGHSMSPDSAVPVYKDDGTDEVLRYEPYWKFHGYDKEAEAVLAKLSPAASGNTPPSVGAASNDQSK
jgi:hypothetical protein